jgi:tetratricopeptide (TPR) repeat protein
MFDYGCDQMSRKGYREAIGTFTEVLSANPEDSNALFRRGQCFYYLQDPKRAVEDFSRSIELRDGNYQIFLWRGSAYAKLDNDRSAIVDYEHAMQLAPNLIAAFKDQKTNTSGTTLAVDPAAGYKSDVIDLGTANNAMKDYAAAVANVIDRQAGSFMSGTVYGGIIIASRNDGTTRILYQPPRESAEITSKSGHDYLSLKNPKKDLADRTAEIDGYPETPNAFFERARDFQQLGDKKHALQDFTRAIELRPNEVMYYLARAYFYHQEGQSDLADADVVKAQALDLAVPRSLTFDPHLTMSKNP